MQMSLSFCLFPTESDSAHLSNEEAACQLNANSSLIHQKHCQKHLRSLKILRLRQYLYCLNIHLVIYIAAYCYGEKKSLTT